DRRAAEACRIFETRRRKLGLLDEAGRHERLIDTGVPALDLVLEEPHAPHLSALRLLQALVERSVSCAVGMAVLDGEPPLAAEFQRWGLERMPHETAAVSIVPDHSRRSIGGAGTHDEVNL